MYSTGVKFSNIIKKSIKDRSVFFVRVIFRESVYLAGLFYCYESRKLMTKAATGTEKVKMLYSIHLV